MHGEKTRNLFLMMQLFGCKNQLENGVIVPVKRSFLVMKNKHFYMNQGETERFYQKLKIYF